jgi:hypothetical protein
MFNTELKEIKIMKEDIEPINHKPYNNKINKTENDETKKRLLNGQTLMQRKKTNWNSMKINSGIPKTKKHMKEKLKHTKRER